MHTDSIREIELPKVSVGLPVRNGAAYLEDALVSLATQDYPNLEIIVSDNASTDATKDILVSAQQRFPSIRVFTQSNIIDATDNFTFVLEKATGDYFCWAADDDVRAPGALSRLADVLGSYPELVCVMSDVVNLHEDSGQRTVDRLEGIRLEKVLSDWPSIRRLFFEVPTSNIYFCVYGLYRTEVLRRINMKMNLGFSANTEIPMLAQVALLGGIASIDAEDFIYRRHSQSIYHRETANEANDIPFRRRTAIRNVLARMVGESSLPETEKQVLGRMLEASEAEDQRMLRDLIDRAQARKQRTAKAKRKSPKKSVPIIRRLRRLKSLLLGRPLPDDRDRKGKAQREERRKERQAIRREKRRKEKELLKRQSEGVLACEVDLSNPDYELLLDQERERRRLAGLGWSFIQSKRIRLIQERGISTLLDCGSNAGQYVEDLFKAGWSGRVISFEPLSDAFAKLRAKAESCEQWQAYPFALGEENKEATIQIAGNSMSSSLLPFSEDFRELRPDASPVGSETVTVRRLDDVVKEEGLVFDGPVMLKLDVQGFELSVLRGALETLKQVSVLQCELALIPSYEGGTTFVEVRDFLRELGFVLAHIIDGHTNHETGELREVDGIFLNTRLTSVR